MPWVRLDENVMDHPKFLALSDGAWRLWCEGLAYCQKHLTDGVIFLVALRGFRYFSPGKLASLTQPVSAKAKPLWTVDGDKVVVNDYLDWNDPRVSVLAARAAAKKRQRRFRHGVTNGVTNAEQTALETPRSLSGVSVRDLSLADDPDPSARTRELQIVAEPPSDGIAHRAGAFVERYQDLHLQHRGVAYVGNPRKDYEEALRLVAVYDDDTIRQLAIVFLHSDDEFVRNGTATVSKFRSRATWCQERLNAEKRRRGIA